jgi:hypothetical protein
METHYGTVLHTEKTYSRVTHTKEHSKLNFSVVDRHRFDSDPDPTFHFDADPDPDPDPTSSYTQDGNQKYTLDFNSRQCRFTLIFTFLISVTRVIIFSI